MPGQLLNGYRTTGLTGALCAALVVTPMACASSTEAPATTSAPTTTAAPAALASMSTTESTAAARPRSDNDVVPHGGMMRYPDISADHIVFVYANDLWVVPRAGGTALPLASPPGMEGLPKFSPDGDSIAFVGNYDGGRDLYTIPVGGGVPNRVTHHPSGPLLCDWTPDGRLLFSMSGMAGLSRQSQLFVTDADGGLPEQMPVPYGAIGSVSPDGQWLAYVPHTREFRTWKRYQGGMATDIWLFNLNDHSSQKVTDWLGTDTMPMWVPGRSDTLYYLSDDGPQHRLNIWSYDVATGAREQVTEFADYDVKWPSIGPGANGRGEIVFQLGSQLMLLDLANGQSNAVDVTVPGDRPTIRPNRVDVRNNVGSWSISSTGQRAVADARGDIWTVPAEHGSPRNLHRTSGTAERYPAWSPDGRWIAYFSDATGEYELYITQSDGRGETRQLTHDTQTYYFEPIWSPDSKHILFTDKSGGVFLTTVESGETKQIDTDPWAWDQAGRNFSWSHDSRWIVYQRSGDDTPNNSIFLYNIESGERTQVTSDMFSDGSPAFDRKGDWLFYTTTRSFNPSYSDLDTTFIYAGSQVLVAVPLRADVESPWLAKSDEEEWKDDEDDENEDEEGESGDAAGDAAGDDADDDADESDDEPRPDDGVSGQWECNVTGGEPLPPGGMTFSMNLRVADDGAVSGNVSSPMGDMSIDSGTYDANSGQLVFILTVPTGETATFNLTVANQEMTGSVTAVDFVGEISGRRVAPLGDDDADDEDDADLEARDEVTIDIDGFEARGIMLPVGSGNFGNLAVNDKNQVLYSKRPPRGAQGQPGIYLFDLADEKKEEKSVAAGAFGYAMSADGKKILIPRGNSATIQNAAAGATGKPVVTEGMTARINPREEWRQIFVDAWRRHRDFFYDPNMHGVDWDAVREQYEQMLADCVNREDVSYVIGEMIAELNVGHAYYWGGDVEGQPSVNVGMLGVDFEIDNGAYRIATIYEGAPWDIDARGPLSQPGVDVKEGDYLLAVDGVDLSTDVDPWAYFVGKAGRVVTLTVSDTPEVTEEARHVNVEPIGSEQDLRYRAWIEANRKYVAEQTDGRVGYIYVPNTGVQGQNELVRQFIGQLDLDALIIDERWNGGGQIPTRFIEMLNRPTTNYWARRDGRDWRWPPDSHQGPKVMLINGLAGSGGDAFPYYFRQAGLGKLVGMRTWGGLVGITGMPPLIDGGYTAVPTFAFYDREGEWAIEGWGVDPDIEVVDDPALMVDGSDPQLDAAIEHILEELERNPPVIPGKPEYPDRSGFGIDPAHR